MPIPSTVFLPQPFANNAGAPFKNTIPNTSVDTGLATWNLGFPPLTMQDEVSGGKPPLGQDFNGILNALSTHVFAQQAGQLYRYSSDVSTAIGGYPVGTMLESSDGVTVWFNTVAANTSDPDANGAGWVPMFNYGYTTKAGLTGGTVTLTRLEARRGVIVLTGTLVANLAVVLPTTLASWLIVNSTTGAFTTTVRTAAGTGVVVPQGGFPAPTGVYGDGTNIYFSAAPVNLPIDQAATPLTIAQRTNVGYLLAVYFNQSSGLENPTIGSIFVQNSVADGYLRKISIANFAAQIGVSQFSGQVANAQVPQSAVTQHSAAVLASAALTGTPTAPTAALGSSSSQVATTAFANAQGAGGRGAGWQAFTVGVDRSRDVTYTNNAGRAIEVIYSAQANFGGFIIVAVVDGTQLTAMGIPYPGLQSVTFMVPDGSTYQIGSIAGTAGSEGWVELR